MKRKRWLVPTLTLAITAAMLLPAAAVTEEEGTVLPLEAVSEVQVYEKSAFLSVNSVSIDGVTYTTSNGYASVVGYTGDISRSCTIPATITVAGEEYTVTELRPSAFYNCSNLEYITLPEGLSDIGRSAFQGCVNLKSVRIPSTVILIGEGAFEECYALTSIDVTSGNADYHSVDGVLFWSVQNQLVQYPIGKAATEYTMPGGIESVGPKAFYQARNLKRVVLADSVTSIKGRAFEECSALEEIDLGESLQTVEDDVFVECSSLKRLSFPATLTQYDKSHGMSSVTAYEVRGTGGAYSSDANGVLFCGDTLIQYPSGSEAVSYTVPNGVTRIDDEAFWDAENLQQVQLPNTLEAIGWGAFTGSGLTSVTVPDSVTELGTYTFQVCHDLTSVTLGTGVTRLEDGLFSNCSKLTSFTIPSGVTEISAKAFQGCRKLADLYVAAGNTAFSSLDGVLYSADKSKLVMFPAAKQIERLDLPAEVNEVTYGALSLINTLKSITVASGNSVYYSVDGVLFERGVDENGNPAVLLHTYPQGKEDRSYTVPDGVTIVAEKAAEDHEYLEELYLNDVLEIREDGFGGTGNLSKVDLGNVKILGQSAFISSGVTAVTIPASVTYMDTQTFDYCHRLDHMIFKGQKPPEDMNMLCLNSDSVRYIYVPEGTQVEYKLELTGKANPGAMIVEGDYIPEDTLSDKIEDLTEASSAEEINEVAAGVVRLTDQDKQNLSDGDIRLVEELFAQLHEDTLTREVLLNADVDHFVADGLALASGLVEQQSESGVVSGDVSLYVWDTTQQTGDLLTLEFSLSVNGEETQPKSPVLITVSIPQGTDPSSLELYHIDDRGNESLVPFSMAGNLASFRANEFSSYTFRENQDQEPGLRYHVSDSREALLVWAGYEVGTGRMCAVWSEKVTGTGVIDVSLDAGLTYKAFVLDPNTYEIIGDAQINL